jgi:hypothetical protein
VGGDQILEHFGYAFGGAPWPETLNRDAGTFNQQEQFVGEKLGITQPRLAAKLDDPVAASALDSLNYAPGRMIGLRQFDRRIGEGAPALTAELEFGEEA